jgi:hypothetical protein
MTSLLSDMRTTRPQGRIFRITQPHGLRLLYLGTPTGRRKRLGRVYSQINRRWHVKTKLDFVINLRIAKATRLDRSVDLRTAADEVIESNLYADSGSSIVSLLLISGLSYNTTFNKELWISSLPL